MCQFCFMFQRSKSVKSSEKKCNLIIFFKESHNASATKFMVEIVLKSSLRISILIFDSIFTVISTSSSKLSTVATLFRHYIILILSDGSASCDFQIKKHFNGCKISTWINRRITVEIGPKDIPCNFCPFLALLKLCFTINVSWFWKKNKLFCYTITAWYVLNKKLWKSWAYIYGRYTFY